MQIKQRCISSRMCMYTGQPKIFDLNKNKSHLFSHLYSIASLFKKGALLFEAFITSELW